jgi:hypothetical protein
MTTRSLASGGFAGSLFGAGHDLLLLLCYDVDVLGMKIENYENSSGCRV